MHDTLFVRRLQSIGDLTRNRQSFFQRNTALGDPIGQH